LTLGGEFHSNAYLTESDPKGGFCLIAKPEVSIKAPGPVVDVRATGIYDLRKFLSSSMSNLDRFGDFNATLGVAFLPRSMIGFEVGDQIGRTSRPAEAEAADNAHISRFTNRLHGGLLYRPGPALQIKLGGAYRYEDYDISEELNPEGDSNYNSRGIYGPSLDARWYFLPRTAVIVMSSLSWFDWENNIVHTPGAAYDEHGEYLGLPDGSSWRVQAGMTGRVTERFAVQLLGGYGELDVDPSTTVQAGASIPEAAGELDPVAAGFGKDLTGIDGVLLTVNGTWEPMKDRSLLAGYEKSFRETYYDNYIAYQRVFVKGSALLASHYLLTADVQYRFEDNGGEWSRVDHVLHLGGTTGYRATRYFDFLADLWWDRRTSADHAYPEIEYDNLGARLSVKGTY
jgi:hypothetical protein